MYDINYYGIHVAADNYAALSPPERKRISELFKKLRSKDSMATTNELMERAYFIVLSDISCKRGAVEILIEI